MKVDAVSKSARVFKLAKEGGRFLSRVKSLKILGNEMSFYESDEARDYVDELINFLSGLELDKGERLVSLIDEFPQTILNLVAAENGNPVRGI